MRLPHTWVALATLIWAAALNHLSAQTNGTSLHTNLLLNVSVSLTAYVQQYTTVGTNEFAETAQAQKISPTDFVSALISGFPSNDLSGAKLMMRWKDVGTTNSTFDFILKKGDSETSLNFSTNHPQAVFTLNGADSSDIVTRRKAGNGTTNSLEYILLNYGFTNPKGSANSLSGFSKIKSASLLAGKQVISMDPEFSAVNSAVTGGGNVGGRIAVFKGTINIGGRKVEVVTEP